MVGMSLAIIVQACSVAKLQGQEKSLTEIADVVRNRLAEVETEIKGLADSTNVSKNLRQNELLEQFRSATPDVRLIEEILGQYEMIPELHQLTRFEPYAVTLREFLQAAEAQRWNEIERLTIVSQGSPRQVSEADLNADRNAVRASVERAENRLRSDAYRDRWRKYLRLDKLKKLIQPDTIPDESELSDVSDQLWLARAVWTEDVIKSLEIDAQQFARDSRVFHDHDYLTTRQGLMRELLTRLQECRAGHSGEAVNRIGELVGWLSQRDDSPKLVDALNNQFLRPNLVFRLSEAVFRREMNQPITEQFQINDVFVGTAMSGQGTFSGAIETKAVNRDGSAAIELELNGRIQAKSSGSQQGVTVSTTGNTTIRGKKTIRVRGFELIELPATVDANSSVNIDSLNSPGGRFGTEARNRVYGSRPQAELESRVAAERFIRTRFDELAHSSVVKINQGIRQSIIYPLTSFYSMPRFVNTTMKGELLEVTAVQSPITAWGADAAPPVIAPGVPCYLQVHQSAIEHVAHMKLSGRKFSTLEFQSLFSSLSLGQAADSSERAGDDSINVTFDDIQPAKVELNDDHANLILNLKELQIQDRTYYAMEIRIGFQLQASDGQLRLARNDAPRVVFVSDSKSGAPRVSGNQIVVRKTITNRLTASIPAENLVKSLLPANMFRFLKISGVSANNGWLTIMMNEDAAVARSK